MSVVAYFSQIVYLLKQLRQQYLGKLKCLTMDFVTQSYAHIICSASL